MPGSETPIMGEDGTLTPQELQQQFQQHAARYRRMVILMHSVGLFLTALIGIAMIITMTRVLDVTGESSQRRQAEAIDGLVLRIDCNNRLATQEVLDSFAGNGEVSIVSDQCEQFATSTTEGP